MNKRGSIAYVLEDARPSIFTYFGAADFHADDFSPERDAPRNMYDKSKRLTNAGLRYILNLKSHVGKRLSELRDAFLRDGNKSKLVSDLAGDMHQLLEQAEGVEASLRSSNMPLISYILERDLPQKGLDRLFKAGHTLTDLAETCAHDALNYVDGFDPRKTGREYYNFLRSSAQRTLHRLCPSVIAAPEEETRKEISWGEFKKRCLDQPNYKDRARHIMPLLKTLPLQELKALTARYGLDGKKKRSLRRTARKLKKNEAETTRLVQSALARLALKVEPGRFLVYLSPIQKKVLERRFGLTKPPLSYAETAGELGILPYRVQIVQREAVVHLSNHL